MLKLSVLIVGSTGYIGIQLVKILIKHKNVNIKFLCGNTSVGKKISFYDKSLIKKKLPRMKTQKESTGCPEREKRDGMRGRERSQESGSRCSPELQEVRMSRPFAKSADRLKFNWTEAQPGDTR